MCMYVRLPLISMCLNTHMKMITAWIFAHNVTCIKFIDFST